MECVPLSSQLEPASLTQTGTIASFRSFHPPGLSFKFQFSMNAAAKEYFFYVNLVICLLFKTYHFSLGPTRNSLSFLIGHKGLSQSFQRSQNQNLACHQRKGPFIPYSHSNWHDYMSCHHGKHMAWLLGYDWQSLPLGKTLCFVCPGSSK